MPYATQRDRTPRELELTRLPWPAAPLNLFMTSGYEAGVIDLSWDDPSQLALNSRFTLLGVNIYRSFDSAYGPFQRVTDFLLGSKFWRDRTQNELVVEEDVTHQFIVFGECAAVGDQGPRYIFKTRQNPIVKAESQQIPANVSDDIRVYIDGVEAKVLRVWGATGEVEIDPLRYANVAKQNWDPAIVPHPGSRVTCTYRYTKQLIRTDLGQRIHYRATAVGIPIDKDLSVCQPQDLVETPLEHATATHTMEVEKLDYIWEEAIHRNRWILEQGGERVKAFLRKNVGIPCPCIPDHYHKQPVNDHSVCFGTGIIGGYDGPYDIIVAPPKEKARIAQTYMGRTLEKIYDVWTGPVPLLSMRDFIVKINGDRYTIGSVEIPSNRGNVLQQMFNLGHIDEKDIRYKVPVTNPIKYVATELKPTGPEEEASARITNKPNIPQEDQLRGRSIAWENISY